MNALSRPASPWGPLALAVAALLVPRRAQAEPPVGAPLEVTAWGAPNAVDTGESPRATTHVTTDRIREAAPGSLADALRGRAGVAVQQTTPGQGTVYVRGLSSREVLHLVDGVPLNAAIFRAGNNPYLGLVDPYSFQSIDVVRGASSVVHGSDALGGVVSMSTELPGYSLVAGGATRLRALQGLTVAPLGSASHVSVEHRSARFAALVGFTYTQAGDLRPGGGLATPAARSFLGLERAPGGAYLPALSGVQEGTAFQTYAANAALRARLGAATELVLRAQLGLRPEMVRYDEVNPLFKNERPARAESSIAPFYRAMTSATLLHRGGDEGSVYRGASAQLAWQRLSEGIRRRGLSETCFEGGAPSDADPCPSVLRLVPKGSLDRESNRSDALSLRAEARLGGRAWGLRLGADASHDLVSARAESLDLATLAVTPQPERFPDGSSQTQAGAFAMAELEPVRGLHLYAGARGALFHLGIRERAVADPTGSPAFTRTVVDVALNAGARLDLAPGASFVLNAGRGVRAPNVQDFSGLGARAKGRFQLPNPDIRPEHTLSLDAGFRAAVGKVRAETYVFYLRYLDAIALAPTTLNGAATNAAGERYERSENAALVEYFGVESALHLPFASFIGLDAQALAMIGTQHNDPGLGLPEVTPADRTPPATATLTLWVTPIETLRLEATAYGRLAQRRLNDPTNLEDNRIPEGGTPGFVSFRVQGAWRARPDLTARLAIDNLTDAQILEHGSGFYRPGLNGSASLEAAF